MNILHIYRLKSNQYLKINFYRNYLPLDTYFPLIKKPAVKIGRYYIYIKLFLYQSIASLIPDAKL